MHKELASQLEQLIHSRLLDPIEILFHDAQLVDYLRRCSHTMSKTWAAKLLGDDNPSAVATAMSLLATVYPGDTPFDPPSEWWGTPFGRIVLLRVGHPAAIEELPLRAVEFALDAAPDDVHRLIVDGDLEAPAHGRSVTTASVRNYLAASGRDSDAAEGPR